MAGINELMKKIESDAAFKMELEKASDLNEYLNKIKEAGFDVTIEEIADAVKSSNSEELDDDDLENVAGGFALTDCGTLRPLPMPAYIQREFDEKFAELLK